MPSNFSDKPSYEEYARWYDDWLGDDLESGRAERWYELVTDAGITKLEDWEFWKKLQASLATWDASFKADHEGYSLFGLTQQPKEIGKKTFESVLNKSFRWNVLDNGKWPDPPEKSPSTVPGSDEHDPHDPQLWFGPQNWLTDFSDIFRTRLATTYFDGVGYLADKIKELAEQTTQVSPCLQLQASHDGYHAAHLTIYHQLDTLDYENSEPVSVRGRLEIQVTTTIQATITEMLHSVYEEWRMTGPPPDWEWDQNSPAFSVNYLGSTLHYLEGMIVVARDKGRTS